jgi:hypothetical protein
MSTTADASRALDGPCHAIVSGAIAPTSNKLALQFTLTGGAADGTVLYEDMVWPADADGRQAFRKSLVALGFDAAYLIKERTMEDVASDVEGRSCTLIVRTREGEDGKPTCVVEAIRPSQVAHSRPAASTMKVVSPFPIHSVADVIAEDYQFQWLIKGLWPQGSYGQIAGQEKTLKSWLTILIALCVASGRPLLDHFPVPHAKPVVVFTGEAGRHSWVYRLQHLAGMMGFTDDEVKALPITIVDVAGPIGDPSFMATYQAAIDSEPGLIILDPLYRYAGKVKEAGNVYEMGGLLGQLFEPTTARGISLIIVNHFNKAAGTNATLQSITQAGSRETADSWLLISHREMADVEEQSFKLKLNSGGRLGFGGEYDLDVELGPLNLDTLRHEGTPSFTLTTSTSRIEGPGKDPEAYGNRVVTLLTDEPWVYALTDIKKQLGGNSAEAGDILSAMLLSRIVPFEERCKDTHGRQRKRKVYAMAGTPPPEDTL